MSSIAIVTDSTADFPDDGEAEKLGIKIVPLTVRFGKLGKCEEYIDKVDLTNQEFYEKLRTCSEETFPKTSLPSPESFLKAYKELDTDKIISIHISEKLSGTANSARRSKEVLPKNFDIRVIDTQTTSFGLGLLVLRAARLSREGYGLNFIEQAVIQSIPKIRLYALFDTLVFLQKGGRIGKASYWLGSILKFKPIIKIEGGEVIPVSRPRSRTKGLAEMIDKFLAEGEMTEVGIVHAEAQKEAEKVREMFQEHYPGNIFIVELGTVLGTHTGPGAIGICGLLKS